MNPHCQHCADERKEQREITREQNVCASCETLAMENARLVRDNERLLDTLLEKPTQPTQAVTSVEGLKPIQTSTRPFIPTAVRRQLLEKEDRHTAQLSKLAPKPDATIINKDAELQALETELDNVRAERESQTVNS